MGAVIIRRERPGDAEAIRTVIAAAFTASTYGLNSEPEIVDRLRSDGDLALSLVAETANRVVGHIAFSPVSISDGAAGWCGLGPISVLPECQRQGIGEALMKRGIAELRAAKAVGIVVLGDPAYYSRVGFECDPQLTYPGAPEGAFQRLALVGTGPGVQPNGTVRYALAFA